MTQPPLIRNSERTTFTRCPQAWEWTYVDLLKPKTESPPLRFGTLIHKALEDRYPPGTKRGPHPAKRFKVHYQKELETQEAFGFKDEDGTWHDALGLGIDMMEHFVEVFGNDDEFEVLASEQQFKVPVKRGRRTLCYAVGTIDGLWRHIPTGRLWINDWKTAKSISTSHLILDEQNAMYWTFGTAWLKREGILPMDQDLEGIMFTFMRKAMRDTRPQNEDGHYLNKDGSVSKSQPSPYFERVPTYLTAHMRRSARRRFIAHVERMLKLRQDPEQIFKTPGRQSCSMCSMRDMCQLHEAGADWESFRDGVMTTWDPYAAHEIESEGKG